MGTLTLTDLANDIYTSADLVGRELVGLIPSVTINSSDSSAAVGDTIKTAISAEATGIDISSASNMTIPDSDSYSYTASTMSLDKSRAVRIPLTGETTRTLQNNGTYATAYGNAITQAMRTLTNEIEAEIGSKINLGAGYAFGDGSLFNTSNVAGSSAELDELAQARKILVDGGCPTDDISAVIDTLSGVRLRKVASLLNANTAGNTSIREQGILIPVFGVNVRESSNLKAHTAGAQSGADGTAIEPIGETTVAFDGATVNTTGFQIGDVITVGSQTTKYVIGAANTDTSGNLTLNAGLRVASADDDTIVTSASHTASAMFHRNAVELVMRAPARPDGGDAADDVLTVTDPHSGLVFQVAIYRGYHKSLVEVSCVYGAKVWKPEFVCKLVSGA